MLNGLEETTVLTGDEWHHCHNVLRMGIGDPLIIFDGKGQCFEGIIRSASRNEGEIELLSDQRATFQLQRPYTLSIAFAPTKNIDRTEFAVEKLVELGVDEIYFLDCDHSERSRLRMDRMEKIILSAAKQSRKIFLPRLSELITPAMLTTQYKREQPNAPVFCCHLDASSGPLVENYTSGSDVLLIIGPEGGFSNEETDQLRMRGAQMVTLGPYRLRVETAVITACAAIHIINEQKQS